MLVSVKGLCGSIPRAKPFSLPQFFGSERFHQPAVSFARTAESTALTIDVPWDANDHRSNDLDGVKNEYSKTRHASFTRPCVCSCPDRVSAGGPSAEHPEFFNHARSFNHTITVNADTVNTDTVNAIAFIAGTHSYQWPEDEAQRHCC